MVLAPFSDRVHEYAKSVLEQRGVRLELGTKVTEVRNDRVCLSDGREIKTRSVVWAGGIKVGGRGRQPATCRAPRTDASRSDPTSPLQGFPACTRSATSRTRSRPTARRFHSSDRSPCKPDAVPPRTSSPTSRASEPRPFRYRDKGIMAMIGRNAAVAEVGAAPTGAARRRRLRVLARGARVVAQRYARPDAGARLVGVGLRRNEARVGVHQPARRGAESTGTSSRWCRR